MHMPIRQAFRRLSPIRGTLASGDRAQSDVPPSRLLFVGTSRGPGGTESHLVTLATAMAQAGHLVSAVVSPGAVIARALSTAGSVTLYSARFARQRRPKPWIDLSRAIDASRPDWIIGSFKDEYWPVALVGRAHGKRVALFSHLDQRTHPLMLRVLPRLIERLIVPSHCLRARFAARGVSPERTTVLGNPVDTTQFRIDADRRCEMRRALGFGPEDVVVGFVGRLERFKGVDVLAEALSSRMRRCAQLRALWVGHGELAADLRAGTVSAGQAERHVWRPWAEDVAPFMAAMDVLALPSVGAEAFGRVLIEAQASGVPVLGSRIGGIPEALAEGESGLLVPPGDAAAWEEAIARLVDDRLLRQRMSAAARPFVIGRFDTRTIASQFGAILGL